MGLFQHDEKADKKKKADEQANLFYDEYFREELRNHSRWYFEKIINENAALFKQDLDTTIGEVHVELKEHLTKQLDKQFTEYGKSMKDAQEDALSALNASAKDLQVQHKELAKTLEQSVAEQDAELKSAFAQNKAQIAAMKEAQDIALESINRSAKDLQDERKELNAALQKSVADQQEQLVNEFQEHMAQVVEHYLLGALSDQYDLKAQLPLIIKQLEDNKKAIVDDMKL